MVYKCCVPRCTSRTSKFPIHRFPKNVEKAEIWLRAIGRTDMIGVDKQTLDKLRICSEHFSEDMVLTYTSRRVLKDCARPVLNLPVDILQENVNMDIEEILENVQSNPDLESMSTMSQEVSVSKSMNEESVHEEDQGSRNKVVDRVQLIKSTPDATLCHLRKKVRVLQKRMHKQKKSSQKKTSRNQKIT
ncbi:uncharacterized protein [Linepithema humile]|uniref:uncharacterized protein n=1 Tax=Linepithema humile TaxID=83485 RepID=UPI00351F260B